MEGCKRPGCQLLVAILLSLVVSSFQGFSQQKTLEFDPEDPFRLMGILDGRQLDFSKRYPLFSVESDSMEVARATFLEKEGDTIRFLFADSLRADCWRVPANPSDIRYTVRFTNTGKLERSLENLVPCGRSADLVHISASGSREWPGYLCRSKLFRPGKGPVGVILPDNAWHLGFADVPITDSLSVAALARRGLRDKDRTAVDRWRVTLRAGGWAEYNLWFSVHPGDWRSGLKRMFGERWLYDLDEFDNTLFQRSDLAWMKRKYIMLLQFAWDKKYFDQEQQMHTWYNSLFEYDALTGGYDIFTLWPTWPRLGLDPRNQWDMYRDLPGGLKELSDQVRYAHSAGKRYFISYNPWDEGTREEDQLTGMEELLRATGADGAVLDTRGASSKELQAAADRVRPGIIMYSEGMAVPRDMPGIVSGRVHDALVLPPVVNLNRLIKPDFAIFRVLQLADDRIHREVAASFFNGYGVEINTMRPGRPDWIEEEYAFLGRTTRILRDNAGTLTEGNLDMLWPVASDSVYANAWHKDGKWLFTVYCAKPEGYSGNLLDVGSLGIAGWQERNESSFIIIDLWNHEEISVTASGGKEWIPVSLDGFSRSWLNTRREGSVGCLAVFPRRIIANQAGDRIHFTASDTAGCHFEITRGNPTYAKNPERFASRGGSVGLRDTAGRIPEKIIVRLFRDSELLDERVLKPAKGMPVRIGLAQACPAAQEAPPGMVPVPGGDFRYYTRRNSSSLEPFIPLPDEKDTVHLEMKTFYCDIFPVTNNDFLRFIRESGYRPVDTTRYLKHWRNGSPPVGTGDMPVVYVSLEDARAYADWAGKRLPTSAEWQFAAQGDDMRRYPWGNSSPDSTRCNLNLNYLTPVSAHPRGASPSGVQDLIGNVWQMTADVYDNGSYLFNIIRGGSHYHPTQSIWYVTGGPLPVHHPEMLLLISPGLDRNATVGFRCVRDAE